MNLHFTIDTDELYGDGEGSSFEDLLTSALKNEIIRNAKKEVTSEKFAEFSKLTSDTIVSEIKLRLMNFLSEEIVLTGRYGEKNFVGSIEDLIKKRFDDILLRPVDGNGKTLQGCTSEGKTWIEWEIENKLMDIRDRELKYAAEKVAKEIEKKMIEVLTEFKNKTIKEKVEGTFLNLINSK